MLSASLLLLTGVAALVAGPESRTLTATRTATAPTIDGDLSDAVWSKAAPSVGFRQQTPRENQPESGRTEVRLLYDDDALYFAFHCQDPEPSGVAAHFTRRDTDALSDAVMIDLDTEGDHERAFHFEVSAAGVQRDAIRTGDSALAFEWDAVWTSAVRLTSDGWAAEVAIPYTALRYSNNRQPDWRVELRRFTARTNELDMWVFVPLEAQGEMQRYGRVDGLSDLPKVHGIVLQPFVTTNLQSRRAPPQDGVPTGTSFAPGLGLDAQVGLTPGLTLSATVLPDFGQVEADPATLNLTKFELHLTERRPFFLEGADLFSLNDASGNPLGTQLFYSRRLGARPADAYLPAGANVLDAPDVTTLWSATKLTGRIGDRLTVALLDGVAASESARIQLSDGSSARQGVAPLTNFFVGRLRMALIGNLTAGLSLTSVARQESPGSIGLAGICPDGNPPSVSGRCTHDAQTVAADLSWQTADGGWVAAGTVYGSRIAGGPARAYADGSTIASGDRDLGGRLELVKSAGNIVGAASYEAAGPKLDLNDAGYLRQQNFHQIYGRLGGRVFDRGTLQDASLQFETWLTNSWDGVPLGRYFQLTENTDWKDRWNLGAQVALSLRAFDNRDVGDGTVTERPANLGGSAWVSSNFTKPLSFWVWAGYHNNWHGTSMSAGPGVNARLGERVSLSLSTTVSSNTGDPRYVTTLGSGPERRIVLGAQDSVSASSTLRSTFTFSNTMTLQAYAQLFFASVRYTDLFSAAARGDRPTVLLDALTPAGGDPHQYDSRDAVLNLNLLFRWEYRPGSVLYLVYTRAHEGGDAPLLGTARTFDWSALGKGAITDTFLAKLSYYWGG
jgi:hypothetical protein